MKRKVLHLLGSLNIGGAENLVLDLARYASENEDAPVEFHLVYMHESLPERVKLFSGVLGERLAYIPCSNGVAKTLDFICSLRKYIKENRIDEIHTHNNVDAYWAYFASSYTGIKRIVLTVHGLNLNFKFLTDKLGALQTVEKRILGKLCIKYVSGVARDFYAARYGWKELEGDVVYNGIDWTKFIDAPVCRREDEPWLEDGRSVFLMAGSFNPDSRLQGLICRALNLLRKEGPLPFKFVFAGAKNSRFPQLYEDCIKFCEENGMLGKDVFFLGGRNDIPSLLSSVQGYVYASESDTFGLSVVEAAGCGLPVLCSAIPALSEVLRNGEFGKLIPNEEKVFAKEMLSLHVQGDSSVDMGARAQQIREIYSIRNCFEGYYGTNL